MPCITGFVPDVCSPRLSSATKQPLAAGFLAHIEHALAHDQHAESASACRPKPPSGTKLMTHSRS